MTSKYYKKTTDDKIIRYKFHEELNNKSKYNIAEFINLSKFEMLKVLVTILAFTCAILLDNIIKV